jgi:hypothetical protein
MGRRVPFQELDENALKYYYDFSVKHPFLLATSGIQARYQLFRIHEEVMIGRSRVHYQFRQDTRRDPGFPALPAPLGFDDDAMQTFVRLLYGQYDPERDLYDRETGNVDLSILSCAIKQFLLCAVYGVESDFRRIRQVLRDVMVPPVCTAVSPALLDILSSCTMGLSEQSAMPLAYEGLLRGVQELWTITHLASAFGDHLESIRNDELVRLPVFAMQSWSAAAPAGSGLGGEVRRIMDQLNPGGRSSAAVDKLMFGRMLLAWRRAAVTPAEPPAHAHSDHSEGDDDDGEDVEEDEAEPEEVTLQRMDDDGGDDEGPAELGWGGGSRKRLPGDRQKDALGFVFGLIVMGSKSHQTTGFAHLWGHQPPSKTDQYTVQPSLCDAITAEARTSAEYWASRIPAGTIVSFDGSWGHRRNSDQCFAAFIAITPDPAHPANGKVVDFEVVQRKFGQQKHCNYVGSSQGMETEALRRMVPRWKGNMKVVGFAHDQDAKAMTLIRELGWQVEEYRDPNHVFKSNFERVFNKWSLEEGAPAQPGKPGRKRWVLKGLKEHLRKWLRHCAYSDFPDDQARERAWMGAYKHYVEAAGGYKWPLRGDEQSKAALNGFLQEMSPYLKEVRTRINTQMNESLNALKAKAADKNISFTASWEARCCTAVLRMNEGSLWIPALREAIIGESLAPEGIQFFQDEHVARLDRAEKAKEAQHKWTRYQQRTGTVARKKSETERGRQGEGHADSVAVSATKGRARRPAVQQLPSSDSEPGSGDMPDSDDDVRVALPVPGPLEQSVIADLCLERPAFLFVSEHMVEGGIFNTDGVLCHFISVLEVFINLPVLQGALARCGDHPVVASIRKLMGPRTGSARLGPLLEHLYSNVPRSIWRASSWFGQRRDPAETFTKLIETFDQLPDGAGQPVVELFADPGTLQRHCGVCGVDVGEEPYSIDSPVRILTSHHEVTRTLRTPAQWVNGLRKGSMLKCAHCGAVAPSSLRFHIPRPRPVIVFNVDGRAAASVAIPDVITIYRDLGRPDRYRLEATVNWQGCAHVITHVRERRLGNSWRRYDDREVTDALLSEQEGMRMGPFKLAFYVPVVRGS